ncbi:MAG: LemA family protein [Alphaproteobacteria bacterium]
MLVYILGGFGVVALWTISLYNGLITLKNRLDEAWSDIEVQMKRRYNLIPNLIETVKGYAKHEKGTFEAVTKARTDAMKNHGTPAEQAKSENILKDTLKSIFALSEAYPELKANTNFLELQAELSDTEDKIQASRRLYNSVVQRYNTKIEIFPNNILAKMFGFMRRDFFNLEEEAARKPVAVKF